ncbi:hypothetical protein [Sinomicrobium soli]|uniref:hypothetical protein n=1 Tax=Sinomicrobium sp. N-1-3-6 TaxID=2219864 RepID=UPI000DCBE46B|nr:hypothetical protein [Sinomicrobium sp. N-1-3-6]RAV29126.1 hypothetical protein DN748_09375 [Sinomicrobium sp. N-1-3-6]
MKKRITLVSIYFILFSAFGQQTPTVEEIYAKYIMAIGGNEKLANIVNKVDVSAVFSEYTIMGAVENQGTTKQEIINFRDYANVQSATILKQFPSALAGDKISFSRYLTANGKTTILFPDGKKQVMASTTYNRYQEQPFPETVAPPGGKVLPNETLNGKEVYVVNYQQNITGSEFNCYAYFETDSGLLVASKLIDKKESFGSTNTTISVNNYEDYKEIGGILIPYKIKTEQKTETTGAVSMTSVTKMQTEVITITFNIDPEDFKQNCFQRPEECFAGYMND